MVLWSFNPDSWSFDVASLMIIVGETEELNYRLSQRSLPEILVTAPVIGFQSYIRSYDFLLDSASHTYSSPYGCKSAPLRNARFDKVISLSELLKDGTFTVFRVRSRAQRRPRALRNVRLLMWFWTIFTWVVLGGILAFLLLIQESTWIGIVNCVLLAGWSMVLRTVEYFRIRPSRIVQGTVTDPEKPDAVFFMGRSRSAVVIEGTRQEIKDWTSRGLSYHAGAVPNSICQSFTRLTTFLLLVFVFVTIPNGPTCDQAAFVVLNCLGQATVFIGRILNSWSCLAHLDKLEYRTDVSCRTELWALLLRKFKNVSGNTDWADAINLLPQTDVWTEWRKSVVKDDEMDPKQLYFDILARKRR